MFKWNSTIEKQYYLNNAKANTINFTYSDTEYAKFKSSDGTIKIIGYTS